MVGAGAATPTPASAHATWYCNSVDSSTSPSEIRYSNDSKYSAVPFAINVWDDRGKVNILPDAWNTVKDLEIWDVHTSDTYAGRFECNAGADNIKMNMRILDQGDWDPVHRRKVALHELGHSLDFDHNDLAWPQSIMRQGKRAQDWLGDHDINDYNNRWD